MDLHGSIPAFIHIGDENVAALGHAIQITCYFHTTYCDEGRDKSCEITLLFIVCAFSCFQFILKLSDKLKLSLELPFPVLTEAKCCRSGCHTEGATPWYNNQFPIKKRAMVHLNHCPFSFVAKFLCQKKADYQSVIYFF